MILEPGSMTINWKKYLSLQFDYWDFDNTWLPALKKKCRYEQYTDSNLLLFFNWLSKLPEKLYLFEEYSEFTVMFPVDLHVQCDVVFL